MSLALDGSAENAISDGTSGTVSLTTSNANDVIIVAVMVANASNTVTITDTSSLTWNARTSANNTAYLYEFYAIASSALSADTITVTLASTDNVLIVAFGVSGANTTTPFNTAAVTNTGSTTTPTGNITTTGSTLVYGLFGLYNTAGTFAAGSGYTAIQSGNIASGKGKKAATIGSEYALESASGTYTVSGTWSASGSWMGIIEAISVLPITTSLSDDVVLTDINLNSFVQPPPVGMTVTINNTSSTAIAVGTQVMVTINMSSFQAELAADCGNIRWYDSSGNEVYGWLETGNSNTSTASNVWLKLNKQILVNSSDYINGIFQSTSTEYDGIYWGEAPQLSGTYAQYDNGANVFVAYWNFSGTALPASLTKVQDITATVNNGLTVTTPTTSEGGALISASTYSYPLIAHALITSFSKTGGTPSAGIELSITNSFPAPGSAWVASGYAAYFNGTGAGNALLGSINASNAYTTLASTTTPSFPFVTELLWSATGNESANFGGNAVSGTDTTTAIGNNYVSVVAAAGAYIPTMGMQYMLARKFTAAPTVSTGPLYGFTASVDNAALTDIAVSTQILTTIFATLSDLYHFVTPNSPSLSESFATSTSSGNIQYQTLTDSNTLAEAFTFAAFVVYSDINSIIDSVVKQIYAINSDTLVETDNIAKFASHGVIDSIVISEVITRLAGVVMNDIGNMAESLQKAAIYQLVDGLSLTDIISYVSSGALSVADSATLSEALTFALTVIYVDNLTVAEAVAKTTATYFADSESAADSILKLPNKELSDSEMFGEILSRTINVLQADLASLGDAVSRFTSISQSDGATLTDTISAMLQLFLSLQDTYNLVTPNSLNLSDTIIEQIGGAIQQTLTDLISLADVANYAASLQVSDNAVLADSLLKSISAALSDLASLQESNAKYTAFAITSSLALAEIIAKLTTASISDNEIVADTIRKLTEISQTENMPLADTIARYAQTYLADAIQSLETQSKASGFNIAEGLSLIDALYKLSALNMSDGAQLSDLAVSIANIIVATLTDIVSETDETLQVSAIKSLRDMASVGEALLSGANKSLIDLILENENFSTHVTSPASMLALSDILMLFDGAPQAVMTLRDYIIERLYDALGITDYDIASLKSVQTNMGDYAVVIPTTVVANPLGFYNYRIEETYKVVIYTQSVDTYNTWRDLIENKLTAAYLADYAVTLANGAHLLFVGSRLEKDESNSVRGIYKATYSVNCTLQLE